MGAKFLTTFHCFKNIFNEEKEHSGVRFYLTVSSLGSAKPFSTNNTDQLDCSSKVRKFLFYKKETVSLDQQTVGFITESLCSSG